MEFCVLASGSSGNASFLRHEGFGVLIDLGLGPRRLERAFAQVGIGWEDVHAALLTHTHGDHWQDACCDQLRERRIPFYCHAHHAHVLEDPGFCDLKADGLVRAFDLEVPFTLQEGLLCRAFSLAHDDSVTCGFRFEGTGRDGSLFALAYAADLGSWHEHLLQWLQDVDVLALEFNHDEILERESGRPSYLVRRVMGTHGHLSNDQAARLVEKVLRRSRTNTFTHVVQLHLSRQCNRPELARQTLQCVLDRLRISAHVHTASADQPTAWIKPRASIMTVAGMYRQQLLPGW